MVEAVVRYVRVDRDDHAIGVRSQVRERHTCIVSDVQAWTVFDSGEDEIQRCLGHRRYAELRRIDAEFGSYDEQLLVGAHNRWVLVEVDRLVPRACFASRLRLGVPCSRSASSDQSVRRQPDGSSL
jgi:hypothetical protein